MNTRNKLIAEFMGARHTTFRGGIKGMTFWSEIDGEPRTGRFPDGSTNIFADKDARYHESWDWLMPVIEKVMNLSSDITPHEDASEDYRATIWNAVCNFEVEEAHIEVAELIEWLKIID